MQFLRKSIVAFVTLAFAAPVHAGIKEEAAKFKGKHIKQVIAKLGYPASERRVLNEKIFTWLVDESTVMTLPRTTYGTHYYGASGSVDYAIRSYSDSYWPSKCKMEFVT